MGDGTAPWYTKMETINCSITPNGASVDGISLGAMRPTSNSRGLTPQWDLGAKFWLLRGKLAPDKWYKGLGPVTVAGRQLGAAELRAALESVARAGRGEDSELSGLAAIVDDYRDPYLVDPEDIEIAGLVADVLPWIEAAPLGDIAEDWQPDFGCYAAPDGEEAPEAPTDPGSPLADAVRESVRGYCRRQLATSATSILGQFHGALAPLVLAALDDLAREGAITLTASVCGVYIDWAADARGEAAA